MPTGQPQIKVTVEYRTPMWFWKFVAFPFHATHYMLAHTSDALCVVLGYVAQELMVKNIRREPLSIEQLQDIFEHETEESFRMAKEFAKVVDHSLISEMNPPMEGYR